MFYKCDCGSLVHLNNNDEIVNSFCFSCFKEFFKDKEPSVYLITYDIPPLRAIFRKQVIADSEETAVDILHKYNDNKLIILRKIELQDNTKI